MSITKPDAIMARLFVPITAAESRARQRAAYFLRLAKGWGFCEGPPDTFPQCHSCYVDPMGYARKNTALLLVWILSQWHSADVLAEWFEKRLEA